MSYAIRVTSSVWLQKQIAVKIKYISSKPKIGENISCGYFLSTIWGFDHIENEHSLCRRKDCMKEFCKSLKEHAIKIINFKKKEMLSLTLKMMMKSKRQKTPKGV